MFLKKKKKKKPLFGAGIAPDCGCCGHGGENGCALGLSPDESGNCPRFAYDPLRRTPRAAPPLKEYSEEDFKL